MGHSNQRLICVSVDIDPVALYLALYGETTGDEGTAALTAQTYATGVERFLDLFDELGVKATFFAVGQDLEVPGAAEVLRRAAAAGHELANHTWSHPYDLIHRDRGGIREEITRGHQAIARIAAPRPCGFRAPGYNTNPAVLGFLQELGYRYDASPLPSWPYLAVKYAVMAGVRLRGARSASIVGDPRMGLGRTAPWREGDLVRFPCAVTRWTRLPVIGTSLVALPPLLRRHLARDAARRDFVSLECHAVDLMDVAGDQLPEALRRQTDLAIPWEEKRARLKDALRVLLSSHDALTLRGAAIHF